MVLEDGCLCHWVRLSPPESIILGSFRLNMVATCDTFGDNASQHTSHIYYQYNVCVFTMLLLLMGHLISEYHTF